jgi:hypothetical protein
MNDIADMQSMDYQSDDNTFGKYLGAAYIGIGIVIICASLVLGSTYAVSAFVLFIGLFVTAIFRKHPLPWISLVSILAANPINWSAAFPCNLILVFCLVLYNPKYLFVLPRWLYMAAVLALAGFVISSGNWMTDLLSILQQTNLFINYLMMPIILLPIVYFRMADVKDNQVKLKGLLFYLILPTTLILLVSYLVGKPIANYKSEVMYHAMDIRVYKIFNTEVNFTRTHAGFIFASLICASTAITIMRVKIFYRLLAALCLSINILMLLTVGSVGSSISSLCGIVAIFFCASLRIKILRSAISVVVVVCMMILVWTFAPPKVKDYVELRYKERFVTKGINAEDRTKLWKRAFDYSMDHPEGVGWSLSYGNGSKKRNAHNDYLLYAINYSVIAGVLYAYLVVRLLFYFFRKAVTVSNDPSALAITLAGLGVLVILLINSMSDHLTANKLYFNIIWSIIWYAYFCCKTDPQDRAMQTT